MPVTAPIPVRELSLDLYNYRTIPQADEIRAVQAMISIKPAYFWALVESLIEGGYLPTENILVLKSADEPSKFIVKEGNRRIAALKLLLGYLPRHIVDIPEHIVRQMDALSMEWKINNENVPCTIYEPDDAGVVDRIVNLTHGKGEMAGRLEWTAVAKARHNRDRNATSEPALDLLEKYVTEGRNLSDEQKERWAGDYPLSVLDEAIKKLAPRFGCQNAPELAKKYPAIPYRQALDAILLAIGEKNLRFPSIRDQGEDFASKYGVPLVTIIGQIDGGTSQSHTVSATSGSLGATFSTDGPLNEEASNSAEPTGSERGVSAEGAQEVTVTSASKKKVLAVAMNDPKAVKRTLRSFKPVGNRPKVVLLRDEMLRLKLEETPLAFCFLLRSILTPVEIGHSTIAV